MAKKLRRLLPAKPRRTKHVDDSEESPAGLEGFSRTQRRREQSARAQHGWTRPRTYVPQTTLEQQTADMPVQGGRYAQGGPAQRNRVYPGLWGTDEPRGREGEEETEPPPPEKSLAR